MRALVLLAATAAARSNWDFRSTNGTVEASRRAAVAAAAKSTVGDVRALLCDRVNASHALRLVAVVGRDAAATERRLLDALAREKRRVAASDDTRRALRKAAETMGFDFRRFDAYDTVVGPAVLAYWQELAATYPRAKMALVLGAPHAPPSKIEARARLARCVASLETANGGLEAGELAAAYGRRVRAEKLPATAAASPRRRVAATRGRPDSVAPPRPRVPAPAAATRSTQVPVPVGLAAGASGRPGRRGDL